MRTGGTESNDVVSIRRKGSGGTVKYAGQQYSRYFSPFVKRKERVCDGVVQIQAVAEEPELRSQDEKLPHERGKCTPFGN
jgi:hypothetical protein